MMKKMKRLLCMFLVLSIAFTASVFSIEPVKAQISVPAKETFYYYFGEYAASFYISGLSLTSRLDPSSVKSSNSNVAEIDYEYMSEYPMEDYEWGQAVIGLIIKKPGKTTVSYLLGTKEYKTVVNVKKYTKTDPSYKYTSPVKTVKVTGLAGGKNLAGKFKKISYVSDLSLLEQQDAVLEVQGKKGWSVDYVSICASNGVFTRNRGFRFEKGNQVKLHLGELSRMPENGYQNISISFSKGSMSESITLNIK